LGVLKTLKFPGILVANVLDLVTVKIVTHRRKVEGAAGGAANGYRSDFMAQMKHINSM
jgi:hypothetical protein